MDTAPLVFEHGFDAAMLEQIDTLRTIRLNLAEKMLKELNHTGEQLVERGLVANKLDVAELRTELQQRIATLRERLAKPTVVFADEVDLYMHLLDTDEELAEELEDDFED